MNDAQAEIDSEYYTIEEVAGVLGVSTDTIRRRIRSGQLNAVKRPTDVPGHGQRWYIPKRALGMQEATEIIQVPHSLTLTDFDKMITARLEAILKERDERVVQVVRTELEAVLKQALDEQLRTTNRRIEGIDRAIRALPAPPTPETITELRAQVEGLKADLAGIKDSIGSIGTIVISEQSAADEVKTPIDEGTEREKEETSPSRWQRLTRSSK